MKIFLALVPEKSGISVNLRRKKRKKPRVPVERQLQRPVRPQPINALNALRDGASCSERLW
ncbi:MAG TPA: hypothetical protein VGR19_12615 [Allosphingosinicella sp.]|nr:hypothetical protein [Allosphingosinicella sp.]